MTVRTVLVVDDDPAILEIASLCLEVSAGWKVLTTSSGSSALDIARTCALDGIVTDYMMPGMDGLTLLRELRADERTRHLPVVMLTAKWQAGPTGPWDDTGIDGVIPKPFDVRSLALEVAGLFGWDADSVRPPGRDSAGSQTAR